MIDIDLSKFTDPRLTEQRRQLVNSLRRRGQIDSDVLDAIELLPRERFIDMDYLNRTYEDNALPIDCNQTISQPYTVAFMTSQLKVKKGDRILEIGTGSGYQAALLYLLGAKVFTIERINELYQKAIVNFRELKMTIHTLFGDGTLGWREFAPYNGIIVTAAAPNLPEGLFEQLAIGGRLVIPIGDRSSQTMHTITKLENNEYRETKIDGFRFVPLIGKEGWNY